ncbi:3-hexulose-6-phosphate synthase [Bariatricus sp. SGI.154]|uniref:3-hexulose-6-phosphate synthase n=1 Tax=Bariatricus sp. SGI.154 TaxID=3420549 RepID=UPI003D01FFC9
MRSKLQIALDDITLEGALELLHKVQDSIDIIEVGTPFMMEYGMEAVRRIRACFPELEILCDGKIMDAGGYEADLAYQAGADYATVLAVTDDLTIADVVSTAKRAGKKVMVDMICVSDLKERIAQIEEMGVDVISVHTGVDQQAVGRTPLDDLKEMRSCVKHTAIAVAGGVNVQTIDDYLAYEPEIIIVGGGIAHAEDPVAVARELASHIENYYAESDEKISR